MTGNTGASGVGSTRSVAHAREEVQVKFQQSDPASGPSREEVAAGGSGLSTGLLVGESLFVKGVETCNVAGGGSWRSCQNGGPVPSPSFVIQSQELSRKNYFIRVIADNNAVN